MDLWSFLAGVWVGAVIGALALVFLRGARGRDEGSEQAERPRPNRQPTH